LQLEVAILPLGVGEIAQTAAALFNGAGQHFSNGLVQFKRSGFADARGSGGGPYARQKQGLTGKWISLPDHASYTPGFFNDIQAQCILITEKDAVKCQNLTDPRIWVVPLTAHIPESVIRWICQFLPHYLPQ
jgi:hypothetical protein